MPRLHLALFACLALSFCAASSARAETRLALVIAEGHADTSEARDAGIVARALAQAGFEVTGHVDLDRTGVLRAFDDFGAEARQAGSDTIVFVYLAGRGVQRGGENYLVPVDATIAREADVPIEAIRLADLTQQLAVIPLAGRIVVLDLARAEPVAQLATGLAAAEPAAGSILAFNASPGTVPATETTTRGLYAEALSEMMATPGLPIETLFARVRLRVVALSRGTTMPWAVGALDGARALFPPVTVPIASLTRGSLEASGAPDAFWAAIARDALPAYAEALKAYPGDPLIARLSPVLAIRREALFWLAAARARTAAALWTYMRRYPRGPHFADARRLLAAIPAALEPPPRFDIVAFPDLPPPKPDELEIVNAPPAPDQTRSEALPVPPLSLVPPIHAAYYDRPPVKAAPGTLPIAAPIALGFAAPEGQILLPSHVVALAASPVPVGPSLSSRTEPALAPVSIAPILAAPARVDALSQPVVAIPREPSVAPVVVPEPLKPEIAMPIAPVIAPMIAPVIAPSSAPGSVPAVTAPDKPGITKVPALRNSPSLGDATAAGLAHQPSDLPVPPKRPLVASRVPSSTTTGHKTATKTAFPVAKSGSKKPVAVAIKGPKGAPKTTPKGAAR